MGNNKATLIIVGGFLGAGKTSLLWETAKILSERGEKVGMITNDQASELVDTTFLETGAGLVNEVSGSCFCCNFQGFADAVKHIKDKNDGGIILAEPVGSCTDLSATILQPVKEKYADDIVLKPLTVLADPNKLKDILADASSSPSYIISKQFEEADIILINKTDLLPENELSILIDETREKWPLAEIMSVSIKEHKGIDEWIDNAMSGDSSGTKLAEVDYDIYAEGEAAFGWLNATFSIGKEAAFEKKATYFVSSLAKRFENANANVGHIKFSLKDKDEIFIGNITGPKNTTTIRKLRQSNPDRTLTVNARVEMDPDYLKEIILEEVNKTFGNLDCKQTALNCLIPGRPEPTYRYTTVI